MADAPSERTRLRRNAIRGVYDPATIADILDSDMLCHVAYVEAGEPRQIPTLYMRQGDHVYLHGNRQSALLRHIEAGGEVVVTVTLVDGVVVARSGFHCSMNYRSVTLFGRGSLVDGAEHEAILDAFVERLIPGHGAAVRRATPQELAATTAVRIPWRECVAKVRAGDPIDDKGDLDAPVWAGVLPVRRTIGEPIPSADLQTGIDLPDYITQFQYPDDRDG